MAAPAPLARSSAAAPGAAVSPPYRQTSLKRHFKVVKHVPTSQAQPKSAPRRPHSGISISSAGGTTSSAPGMSTGAASGSAATCVALRHPGAPAWDTAAWDGSVVDAAQCTPWSARGPAPVMLPSVSMDGSFCSFGPEASPGPQQQGSSGDVAEGGGAEGGADSDECPSVCQSWHAPKRARGGSACGAIGCGVQLHAAAAGDVPVGGGLSFAQLPRAQREDSMGAGGTMGGCSALTAKPLGTPRIGVLRLAQVPPNSQEGGNEACGVDDDAATASLDATEGLLPRNGAASGRGGGACSRRPPVTPHSAWARPGGAGTGPKHAAGGQAKSGAHIVQCRSAGQALQAGSLFAAPLQHLPRPGGAAVLARNGRGAGPAPASVLSLPGASQQVSSTGGVGDECSDDALSSMRRAGEGVVALHAFSSLGGHERREGAGRGSSAWLPLAEDDILAALQAGGKAAEPGAHARAGGGSTPPFGALSAGPALIPSPELCSAGAPALVLDDPLEGVPWGGPASARPPYYQSRYEQLLHALDYRPPARRAPHEPEE